MVNPILITALLMGGGFTAWRLMRERGRIRRMVDKLNTESAAQDAGNIVRLERDPRTGVYAPRKEG